MKKKEVKAVKAPEHIFHPSIYKKDIDNVLEKHGLSCSFSFSDACRWELRNMIVTDDVVQLIVEDLKKIYTDVDYMDLEGVCTPDMIILTW